MCHRKRQRINKKVEHLSMPFTNLAYCVHGFVFDKLCTLCVCVRVYVCVQKYRFTRNGIAVLHGVRCGVGLSGGVGVEGACDLVP